MIQYIIVQAGGKGTRMQGLTHNKPKALVPVNNLPMIFHLFQKYPDKKYIIIGDYQYEVLKNYLSVFAQVDYKLVCASGHTGTCAGLGSALRLIPENEGFMLIWCDLLLPADYEIPDSENNIIGISKDFSCRWKYENGEFVEEQSREHGVAGHFIFRNKALLEQVPDDGEFVRWLKGRNYKFEEQPLYKTHEYGIFSEWDKLPKLKCRPFNSIKSEGGRIYKTAIDAQGEELAKREAAWYKKVESRQFDKIPRIYNYNPLCMELIEGKNIYEYVNLTGQEKKDILYRIVLNLKNLHALEHIPAVSDSYYEAYLGKTYRRLEKVRRLVPFANDETVSINHRVCRNIFYHKDEVQELINQYMPKEFCLIHGDCTFSNIILKEGTIPYFIDPRGYFGYTELFGDSAYDWAKLYYSVKSNYDMFNLKKFQLDIDKSSVTLDIESNQWEDTEDYFFELLSDEVTEKQMKILLAIIWLSLTTYAWEDYDSICGAFYNGLYYLEEALR